MLNRESIIEILNKAHQIDSECELFGASRHQYKLNPPISVSYVHDVEERYGFELPEDYFRFITEIGDGGAGPDYGITEFTYLMRKGSSPGVDKFLEAYRYSLAKPFTPRPLKADELEEYAAIATKEAYERDPDKYFVYNKAEARDLCDTDGFYVLGTRGCQWDFGLITAGERRGQVFDTDNEGGYCFQAGSFEEFYRNWLERISDMEWLNKELEWWRSRLQRNRR